MDWLQGMNEVLEYIEDNLTGEINYDVLSEDYTWEIWMPLLKK